MPMQRHNSSHKRHLITVQSEQIYDVREERDVTETDGMLTLVGVQQPSVLYRVDVHRWTPAPVQAKLQPSQSSIPSETAQTPQSSDERLPTAASAGSLGRVHAAASINPTGDVSGTQVCERLMHALEPWRCSTRNTYRTIKTSCKQVDLHGHVFGWLLSWWALNLNFVRAAR